MSTSLWPKDDTHLWDVRARKFWAREGAIEIEWSEDE